MKTSSSLFNKSVPESRQLIDVALGREAADLAVVNASLLNVYTGEVLKNYAVCAKGRWIAYMGDNPGSIITAGTHVIDAQGCPLIPGLIDGHAHLAWMYTAAEFLKHVIPGGTTTIVTETMETFPVAGHDGVIDFLNSCKEQPVKIFATAPVMVSISQQARGISTDALRSLLERDDILGLGESYWQAVLQDPDSILPIFRQAQLFNKTLEGHTAGATAGKLVASVAAGISSCHEPITADEVLDRLRLGLNVMIREGSIRRDLQSISRIKDSGISFRRLSFVTDGIEPKDLLEKGYMEFVVQKAIDCGFDPVAAIRMATLNVAEHFSIDSLVGGIAPGRFADMLILPDLKTIKPRYVISNGRLVARDGRLLVTPRIHQFSQKSRKSVALPRELKPSDFSVPAKSGETKAGVRMIELITDLVTREKHETLAAAGGEIQADLDRDIIKVAAIDRTHVPGKMFTGFIRGFNLKSGAIASSGAWDTSDIVVVGTNSADMATAVNRIMALQGGAVVCSRGDILAEIPLPIMGIISELPMRDLAAKLEGLNAAISQLGVSLKNPLLTLITLTGAAIPYLRICEEGLVNLKDGRPLGLFID
ncbi:MAG: adenine deaminase C-terminal domain-containing protein [Desulfobacterales bacterium]|nr:adenine deaminase C-terminal domain-containing protein [Desulfobacterales bacterium]